VLNVKTPWQRIVIAFLQAFLATFVVGITGVLWAPNWSAAKAALVSLVIAALTAGFKALQVLLEKEAPASAPVPEKEVPAP
jgi:hypothetical protein